MIMARNRHARLLVVAEADAMLSQMFRDLLEDRCRVLQLEAGQRWNPAVDEMLTVPPMVLVGEDFLLPGPLCAWVVGLRDRGLEIVGMGRPDPHPSFLALCDAWLVKPFPMRKLFDRLDQGPSTVLPSSPMVRHPDSA